MEHRCSARKSFRFQVLLYKNGLPVQAGTCRDLGLGGVYVEAAGYSWRKNEFLEVEFVGADGRSVMKLAGVVVHYSARGAGLMFDAVSNEQRRKLRVLLARVPNPGESAVGNTAAQGPRAVA